MITSDDNGMRSLMDDILNSEEFEDLENTEEPEETIDENEQTEAVTGTVIAEDVLIQGDIISRSNLTIYGTVKGNVSCEGAMTLAGSIYGNMNSQSLEFQKGSIEGNVNVGQWLNAREGTSIEGDITASTADFGGRTKGSIAISEDFVLRSTAVIHGDVKAAGITICAGAKMRGNLDVGFDLQAAGESEECETPKDEQAKDDQK